ncbi:hypothetical protein I5Q34_19690 [Streptomyces sp. AV19]|uniref:hypothetical protein n=1 Tax=Streptomyces sp. AV19 TaxID=2793068 RepID=UPI0018FE839B|nr:hypothetical protein [Streptomyces sp. AV19]MBH1936471.1 hypothetical protein [Streptomyces sp. AV19]MDG4532527.1 hypothetical protein [Streptomyces sp. AV19]
MGRSGPRGPYYAGRDICQTCGTGELIRARDRLIRNHAREVWAHNSRTGRREFTGSYEPCPGSNSVPTAPIWWPGMEPGTPTEPAPFSPPEYGVFHLGACIQARIYSRTEANKLREEYTNLTPDSSPGHYTVHVLCARHRDRARAKDGCDQCATGPAKGAKQ